MSFQRAILVVFILGLLFSPLFTARKVSAATETIPLKAAVLVDETNDITSTTSDLFQRVDRVLKLNKIPFDIIDLDEISGDTFLDKNNSLKFSVLLLLAPGWKISAGDSGSIVKAVGKGMGLVGLLPDTVNKRFAPLFGISKLGKYWEDAESISFTQDKFAFAYEDEKLTLPMSYLNHALSTEADVVALFEESGQAALWTSSYKEGKTVFHNNNSSSVAIYQGILLQSILYAMPVGVALPVNAGVIEIDDCPRAFYTQDELQEWHYSYLPGLLDWLKSYNFAASFFTAFSYANDIDDFWKQPEGMESVRDILAAGYEIGVHCGESHTPLYLGTMASREEIDAEVDAMMQAMALLRQRLSTGYGMELPEVVSYVAPGNIIDDAGYDALATRTDLRYVGVGHTLSPSGEQHPPAQSINLPPPVFRNFGWERDLRLYNVPRVQGGFVKLSQEQEGTGWSLLRSLMESGDAYVAFTHPDEIEFLAIEEQKDITMSDLFAAYKAWADYVTTHYPFYRWWTCARLGGYMENRRGTLSGEWSPQDNTLTLEMPQVGDAIHIKTEKYLKSMARTTGKLILTFSYTATQYATEQFDIIKVEKDYFIYPAGDTKTCAKLPSHPYVYNNVLMPAYRAAFQTPAPEPTLSVAAEIFASIKKIGYLPLLFSTAGATALFLSGALAVLIISRKGKSLK